MQSWRRLLFYLVINIIVSAVTTLLVIQWDRARRAEMPAGTSSPGNAQTFYDDAPRSTLPALSNAVIVIQKVYGAGVLDSEVVLIRRVGEGDLSLQGWRLQDEQGNLFVFPRLTLYQGGAVQLYTRSGENTVTDLFWQRTVAVWQSGETVTLLDPDKNVRATYQVP